MILNFCNPLLFLCAITADLSTMCSKVYSFLQVLFLSGMHDMGEIRIMFSAEVCYSNFEKKYSKTSSITVTFHCAAYNEEQHQIFFKGQYHS
jgi:hypothetical protein